MIVRSRGANVQLRDLGIDTTPSWVIPSNAQGGTATGLAPTWNDAYGLPAVLFCLLLACRTGSQLPCEVYQPAGEGSEKALDAPQRALLHTDPQGSMTPRALWYVALNGVLGHGNALVQKLTTGVGARKRLVGLQAVQPSSARVERRNGRLRYYVGRTEVDATDVIHVQGDLLDDPDIGVSPFTIARETIAAGRASQIFEGRWFRSDGSPSEVITFPGNPSKEQRSEFLSQWEARHQPGTRKTGLLWGGATHQSISVSLADAQWAEAAKISTLRAAQILGMPGGIVDPSVDSDPVETNTRFRELFMQPLLTAIEQALHADDLLFPDKSLFPQFNTRALLRPSLKDRADAYRLFRQGGVLTANEIRALEEYPSRDDGDELQSTPVGGAPNPSAQSDFTA